MELKVTGLPIRFWWVRSFNPAFRLGIYAHPSDHPGVKYRWTISIEVWRRTLLIDSGKEP